MQALTNTSLGKPSFRAPRFPRCVAESECAHATYVVHPQQVIHFSEGHALACPTGSTPFGMIARNNFAPPTIRLGVRNGKMKNKVAASRGLVKISLPRQRQVGGNFKSVVVFEPCIVIGAPWLRRSLTSGNAQASLRTASSPWFPMLTVTPVWDP